MRSMGFVIAIIFVLFGIILSWSPKATQIRRFTHDSNYFLQRRTMGSVLYATKEADVSAESVDEDSKLEEQMKEMITLVLDKAKAGDIEGLRAAGLKVTQIEPKQDIIEEDINNEEFDEASALELAKLINEGVNTEENIVDPDFSLETLPLSVQESIQAFRISVLGQNPEDIIPSPSKLSLQSNSDSYELVESIGTQEVAEEETPAAIEDQPNTIVMTPNNLIFSQLLHATVEDVAAKGLDMDEILEDAKRQEQLRQQLAEENGEEISVVAVDSLNLRTLLGPTILSLTEKLGIDVNEEMRSNPKLRADLNNIMKSHSEEMESALQELNAQQEVLMQQLMMNSNETLSKLTFNISDSAARQGVDSNGLEGMSLQEVLERQASLQNDLLRAREMMEKSTKNLKTLLNELNSEGDLLTYLAMYGTKTWQQQLAVNVGLTLLLKVSFDIFAPIFFATADWSPPSVTDLSISQDISLVLQLGVAVAAWRYAGLLRAIGNSLNKKSKATNNDNTSLL